MMVDWLILILFKNIRSIFPKDTNGKLCVILQEMFELENSNYLILLSEIKVRNFELLNVALISS